ncbi:MULTISPECIES: sporulation membrane protein YtrI [Sutcliffiella]|uniref:Sporulation membrane protein YtrI C-terminal domain-containing protein n=1 Tax=Sutcliffiella cohnii TaxID=33932 RepID=A0A223KTM0_9BACI|nr:MULTISPECIES: sporulation membrane protein YtrI [Sutcliffiella]AST92841.1 hypothetical protein BC6307_16880 [Sutcliffiella cohnii]WBL14097.1 hypothetical protein O1A01_19615 [Sutcliffiella sp. NC1]
MRVPTHHHHPSWQLFFSGAIVGALIGWGIFLIIYGQLQDQLVSNVKKYKNEVETLEERIEILTEDNDKLKEEKDKLKIQDIAISINNYERYQLNTLSRHSIIDSMTKDLNHLISQDIKSLAENKELLTKVIENKSYKQDNKRYYFRVYYLYLDTTLEIELTIVNVEPA